MTQSEYQELAEFIIAQFQKQRAEFNARFDQVDARFEQVSARFEQIDGRLDQMDRRFEQIDARFEKIDARFETLEERTIRVAVLGEDTRSRLTLVVERIDFLDAKVDRLRDEMRHEFASVRQEMRDGLGFWGRRVEAIEARLDREEPR
jgi:chromosome segregation ATPase